MKRAYNSGTASDVVYFTGFEVEKTPAYDMDTLFVVGPQPVDDIIDQAEHFGSQHIYLGANQSFHVDLVQRHLGQVKQWNEIITPLLEHGYWVTLDYDSKYHEWVLDSDWNSEDKFISQISVKLPDIKHLNYNACIKLDDTDFNHSNPGVWIHQVHELMDRKKFTGWDAYSKDDPVKVDKQNKR